MNTNKIKDKIAKGNLSDGIEDLIQLLKDFNDKQMLNEAILLSTRLSTWEK